MTRRSTLRGLARVVLFAIAIVVAGHPLDLLAHVAHDHHHHEDPTPSPHGAIDHEAEATEHESDHAHAWMTPAPALTAPRIRQPQAVAALGIVQDLSPPSPAPAPPFAPPRA